STCPINAAVEVIGDQWSLLVLRDMLLQSKFRFSEFRRSDEGIATNILTARLARLQAFGLIEKHPDPDDGRGALYLPTERALDLIPVLLAAMAWSDAHQPGTAHFPGAVEGYNADPHAVSDLLKSKVRQEREALLP
ncbi:MAG: helix-turn-helix domain-containing protein, partial [Pseudomonadota bacterium]